MVVCTQAVLHDNNLTSNILVNKLALIGPVPFECGSLSSHCFFASVEPCLYSNPELYLQIRFAEITNIINYPEF